MRAPLLRGLALALVVASPVVLSLARAEEAPTPESSPSPDPAPAAAPVEPREQEPPPPHTDQQLVENQVFETYESKWGSNDMDERIRILRWLGQWRHKKVLRELKSVWLRTPEMELKAVAAEGLGNQAPFAKEAGKALVQGLVAMKDLASKQEPQGNEEELQQALEARALVAGLKAIGSLGYKDGWDEVKKFIDHFHDDVAGQMMLTCGALKEYRALPLLLEWFNFYPNGMSWSGGSVSVDTGAAGSQDAVAAKAKWHAKFGGRKRKARPAAFDRLIESLQMITGVKFEKPEQLKEWMAENKVLLRRHGV